MLRAALAAALLFALSVAAARAQVEPPAADPVDARVQGFIEGWLLAAHAITRAEVSVRVEEGVATLSGRVPSLEVREAILQEVAGFDGVREVVDRLESGGAPAPRESRWWSWVRWPTPPEGRHVVRFPRGDLFDEPLADPRQPRFHTTFQPTRTPGEWVNIASVGFGETFGFARWPGAREGSGWQVGMSGAVFAIFNLDADSFDLLNADYVVGFPVSFREGRWSGRFRLFHQSSHLGDEYLLDPDRDPAVERLNLSFEAIEALVSRDAGAFRFYGGLIVIFHTDTPLDRLRLQAGSEFRSAPLWGRATRFVAGLDLQSWEETEWDVDVSLKAGLRFRSPWSEYRAIDALIELYDGHVPHGQFYPLEVRSIGLGLAYGF